MGERKPQNKYHPPGFDPRLLERASRAEKGRLRTRLHRQRTQSGRRARARERQITIRFMMPFTGQCESCGHFIGVGTKFNSKKEIVQGRTYLGIKLHRFFQRCPVCSSTFTVLTDPQRSDYECESGMKRQREPWRMAREAEEQEAAAIDAAGGTEAVDSFQNLEERMAKQRDLMAAHENLDAMLTVRRRQNVTRPEDVFSAWKARRQPALHSEQLSAEEQRELEAAFPTQGAPRSQQGYLRRLGSG